MYRQSRRTTADMKSPNDDRDTIGSTIATFTIYARIGLHSGSSTSILSLIISATWATSWAMMPRIVTILEAILYTVPLIYYSCLIDPTCLYAYWRASFFLSCRHNEYTTSAAGCWHIRGFRMPWHHHGCVIIGLSTDRRLHHNKIIDWPIRSLYSHELMPVPTISWYH